MSLCPPQFPHRCPTTGTADQTSSGQVRTPPLPSPRCDKFPVFVPGIPARSAKTHQYHLAILP